MIAAKTSDENLLVHQVLRLNGKKKQCHLRGRMVEILLAMIFYALPEYSCVSFLPPRPEGRLSSPGEVFLFLSGTVSAWHPSARVTFLQW